MISASRTSCYKYDDVTPEKLIRNTTKLRTHRVQLHLQIFHPFHPQTSYPLLPRKALGQRHLVFLDLELKKNEKIYVDCPSRDTCLSNAFQQTKQWKTPNKWENLASISQSFLQTVWMVAKARKSSSMAWTISQIHIQIFYWNVITDRKHRWLVKEEKWRLRKIHLPTPASNTNARLEIYLRYIWMVTNTKR